MSTRTTPSRKQARWLVPVLSLGFGLIYLIIGLAQHQWGFGIAGLGAMLGYAAVLVLFGRRSEAIGLLGGDQSDERRRDIQLRAAASTGYIVTVVLVAATIWALAANARQAGVLSAFAALAGASWIASTVWFSRRS